MHPGKSRLLAKPVTVAWGLTPWSEGVGPIDPVFGGGPGGGGRAAPRYAEMLRPEGPIVFAGEHLSYVPFWQEGAALSAHAAMRVLMEQAAARGLIEAAARSVETAWARRRGLVFGRGHFSRGISDAEARSTSRRPPCRAAGRHGGGARRRRRRGLGARAGPGGDRSRRRAAARPRCSRFARPQARRPRARSVHRHRLLCRDHGPRGRPDRLACSPGSRPTS